MMFWTGVVAAEKERTIWIERTLVRQNCQNLVISSWRRKWRPTPVLLPGKSHERRSLVGYSPWGCKELDTTKRLHLHLFLNARFSEEPKKNNEIL